MLELRDGVDVGGQGRNDEIDGGNAAGRRVVAEPLRAPGPVERSEEPRPCESQRVRGAVGSSGEREPFGRHGPEEGKQVPGLHRGQIGVHDQRGPLVDEREGGGDRLALAAARVVHDLDLQLAGERPRPVGLPLGDEERSADGGRGPEDVRQHRMGKPGSSVFGELQALLWSPGAKRDDDSGHRGETTPVDSARDPANTEIAAKLEAFSTLLELAGANTYSVRAYRRAADVVRGSPARVADLVHRGRIRDLRGIGPAIELRIRELVETGELHELRELEDRISPDLVGVGRMLGLSAKRAVQIGETLGVRTLEELREAAAAGRLREVPGIGPKNEAKLRAKLAQEPSLPSRALLLNRALELVAGIARDLEGALWAGDPRRMRDRCEQLAVVLPSEDPAEAIRRFEGLPQIVALVEWGDRRAVGVTVEGVAVELLAPPPDEAGAELIRATGTPEYVEALGPLPDGETELEVYRRLGVPWCPPELREEPFRGEPPALVELESIRGDLHCHTTWSDGRASVEEMGRAAIELGYEYLAICDHTKAVSVVPGLDADDVRRQGEEIAAVNELLAPFRILRGTECDIRTDGSLDLPDDVLAELDWVMASVHAGQRGSRDDLTKRTTEAMYSPYVSAISHPTGRIIDRRPPNALDLDVAFQVALETGTALETNGLADRIDLKGEHVRRAIESGIPIVASTDTHSIRGLKNIVLALGTARRGWATAADIVNARPLDRILSSRKPGLLRT